MSLPPEENLFKTAHSQHHEHIK